MFRLSISCLASLLLYLGIVSYVADRPLSLGLLRREILQKTERLRQLPSPKLIILAGSNGPYSHSCEVIGPMLGLPCENAGIAVGFGLDEIFARYKPYISAGDIIYMPMEFQQYTATETDYEADPDGAMLIRHDRPLLSELTPRRAIGALLCCNLSDFLESMIEMPLAKLGLMDPNGIFAREYDTEGDRIDNVVNGSEKILAAQPPRRASTAQEISTGYGRAQIAMFVKQEEAQKVIVIGGLPTSFDTLDETLGMISAVRATYVQNGGDFSALPNLSQYPPSDFFNSQDHLTKPCQYLHSIWIAEMLAVRLRRVVQPPSQEIIMTAAACPSVPANFAELWSAVLDQTNARTNF